MKLVSTMFSIFCLTVTAYAQFDEKPIRVSGVISLEVFPGPPNYESVKDGDKREEAWILTTTKKERFQLVILDGAKQKFATLRRCIQKKVAVDGTVWEAHTGHHHTALLVTVSSIQAEPNHASQLAPCRALAAHLKRSNAE